MRVFAAFAALVTAAVLSLTLVLSALPANGAPASRTSQSSVVDASGPNHGVWLCRWAPRLAFICWG